MAKKPKVSRFSGKVRDNAQKSKSGGAVYGYMNLPKGVSVFSPVPGEKCYLDFMPYVVSSDRHLDGITQGEWWYKKPFKIHRNVGADKSAVVCLTSIGKKCPICECRAQMIKDGRDKADTDALKTSSRNLYVVIPKKNKKFEEKPHIMDISQAMFQNLLAEELEENDQFEVFPDLEQGFTLKIRFDAKTIGSSKPFAEASRIDFEEREETYPESIIDSIPDLDKILTILPYQVLEKKFYEMEDADEETGDEKEPTAPKRNPEAVPDPAAEKDEKEDPDVCIACEGTGENSKGNECRICKGTGKAGGPLPPQPVPTTPVPQVKKEQKRENKPVAKTKCPFDHIFGADCEKYDHCDDCDKWDECIEEKEKK